jgi:hypothetical protein
MHLFDRENAFAVDPVSSLEFLCCGSIQEIAVDHYVTPLGPELPGELFSSGRLKVESAFDRDRLNRLGKFHFSG